MLHDDDQNIAQEMSQETSPTTIEITPPDQSTPIVASSIDICNKFREGVLQEGI